MLQKEHEVRRSEKMSQNKKKTESDVSNQIMTEMETKEQKVEEMNWGAR